MVRVFVTVKLDPWDRRRRRWTNRAIGLFAESMGSGFARLFHWSAGVQLH